MPKLVNTETGEVVKEGDSLVDLRGETWRFITLTRQQRKVHVKVPGSFGTGGKREFNPQVFPGYEIRES